MDIQFFGANCVTLTTKGVRLVVDDNLASLGGKSITKPGDITLYTMAVQEERPTGVKLLVDQPGEYEVSDISIYGTAARAHMDEPGSHSATMYKFIGGDLNLFMTGHIYPDLTDSQLESIGMVDVLVIPVGGNGYTLDPVGALKIIKEIEPKLVIPTHYDMTGLHFPVPQQTLQQALTGLAMEPKETVTKLRLKAADLSDLTQLVVLERS